MFATFVVVWRESLEAVLIVAILLAYLRRIGEGSRAGWIYGGVAVALLACAAFAYGAEFIAGMFAGAGEEIFQATVMVIAAVTVTAMVVWMHGQARNLRGGLERQAGLFVERGQLASLALLAGIAVFREGAETTLFLWGLAESVSASRNQLLLAGAAGAAAALVVGYLIFKSAARLNLKIFFQVTSIVLVFIAAGMLAQAANRLIGVGLLPPMIGQVWNSSWLLDERGWLGSLAAQLFGYRSRPSLLELAIYAAYFPAVFVLMRRASLHQQIAS